MKIGTYPISIIPDQDCCTLFTPRNPQTRSKLRLIEAAEQALPIEQIIEQALADAVIETFEWPVLAAAPGSAGGG
jgi:tRNA uracil 4-sulfurtransferase